MSVVTPVSTPVQESKPSVLDWISNHWFGIFIVVYGLWVFAPFFAPVFMNLGWTGAGKTIYLLYSIFCHQLPERSFFFFGQKTMYSLSEIQAVWENTANPMVLRQFIGNEAMGWKIAWSDRMISFYTSVWLFAVLWWPFRRKMKPLPWWVFTLLLLPMVFDGGSHAVSDIAGIGLGFRDSNQWLATLTNNAFPTTFYVGDALGSFNSWARFVTGLLAGAAIVWLAFPFIYQSQEINNKLSNTDTYGAVLEQIKNKNPNSSR